MKPKSLAPTCVAASPHPPNSFSTPSRLLLTPFGDLEHALNNLLQSHYFEPTDLATIALQLDQDENDQLDRDRVESVNMDDTGFFNVTVLDQALRVWDLSLDRWRSEERESDWDHPECVPTLAFLPETD